MRITIMYLNIIVEINLYINLLYNNLYKRIVFLNNYDLD